MDAALHPRPRDPAGLADHQSPGVPHGGRNRKAGNLRVWDARRVVQVVRKSAQARAEHQANARPQFRFAENEFRRAYGARDVAGDFVFSLLHGSMIPTIEADIRLAIVPASMARIPSRASSSFLFGASAPMPPIWMPMELKLAKPQSA